MASLGQHLRELRTRRKMSLEDIARATRVARRYLDALESDDLASLPAPAFTRGFIRAYCQAVGERPDEALALYDGQDGAPAPVLAARASSPTGASVTAVPDAARSRSAVFVSFVLLVVLGLALFVVTLLIRPPRNDGDRRVAETPVETPPAVGALPPEPSATPQLPTAPSPTAPSPTGPSPTAPSRTAPSPTAPSPTASSPTAPLPPAPLPPAPSTVKPAATPPAPPRPSVPPSATAPATTSAAPPTPPSKPATTSPAPPTPPSKPPESVTAAPTASGPAATGAPAATPPATGGVSAALNDLPNIVGFVTPPYRLIARTWEPTWIRVRMADGRMIEETVPPGQVREWVSNEPFVLTIGNAGGVALELNGRLLPSLGASGGVITRLVLPPER